MAKGRVKPEELPVYADNSPSSKSFYATEGLQVTEKEIKFSKSPKGSDEKFPLVAVAKQVSFGGNMAVATKAFGSVTELLSELEDSVNEWLATQAKGKVGNEQLAFEQKVSDTSNATIANLEQTRGAKLTDEQKIRVKSAVREEIKRREALLTAPVSIDLS